MGQTISFNNRMNRHKHGRNYGGKGCRAIAAAIRKHGWEAMKVEVLLKSVLRDDLDEMERLMIAQHGTYHDDTPGEYNLTRGGDKNPVSDPLVANKMQQMYKTAEWKASQRAGYTDRVRQKVADSQRSRQERGGFEQLRKAGELGRLTATSRSNEPDAKAKRIATWAAKREAKLATMDPEKAKRVRRQAENDAARNAKKGYREGYKEYQAAYRARKKAERLESNIPLGTASTQ